jgi:hypothetical protein
MILPRSQAAASPPALARILPLLRQRAWEDRQHSVLIPAPGLTQAQASLMRLEPALMPLPQPRREDLLRWVQVLQQSQPLTQAAQRD